MYKFNIILTEFCNANCTHCYMNFNSKKKRKTMSFDDIDKIIEKLPKNTDSITLTGGEVFLVKTLLLHTIKKIKEKDSSIKIELESNGQYLYNSSDIKNVLIELKNIGVDSIRFSDDLFHSEGGIDLDKVRDLKKYESEETPIIKFLVQNKVLGIGNATKLDKKYIEKRYCMNSKNTINNPYLFLDINGNVYICTWKNIPPLGNLIDDDFDTIIQNMKNDFFKLILQGKVLDAINMIDNNKEYNTNIANNDGECVLCYKIFKSGEDNNE